MRQTVFNYAKLVMLGICFLFSCNENLETIPEDDTQEWDIDDIEIDNSEAFRNTISETLAENKSTHEADDDFTWSASDEVKIVLNGNSISANGPGVTINGTTATITNSGNYSISGSLDDGQINVNTSDEEIVRLILNGINIKNSSSSPINIESAENTLIHLVGGTTNYLEDGTEYVYESSDVDEPNATLFSKDDLTISGEGSLDIKANYNDGITSKDGLVIKSGSITIEAKDDGIRGKDYLVIHEVDLSIDAGGDGLKSDNDEDATRGYILIENGNLDITCGNDAIQAVSDLLIENGTFNLLAENSNSGETIKGLKAGINLIIDHGSFSIDTKDDAIHSNGSLVINDGVYDISTGDDAIHADGIIFINNGEINVNEAYEGIESTVIKINDGEIHIFCSDDGLNVAGGNDASGHAGPGMGGGFNVSSDYYLFIDGGKIVINSVGDGIDANGYISMSDGTVIINGPTANMNGAIDYDGGFEISGGILVAVGSAGMAQAPATASSQKSMLLNMNGTIPGGTLFHIESTDGKSILNFTPVKNYASVAFSSPDISEGATYEVYYGGSCSGSENDGFYVGGTYSGGTKLGSLTL